LIDEELISNEKQEMMRADSPVHMSSIEDDDEAKNSIDEFIKKAKD